MNASQTLGTCSGCCGTCRNAAEEQARVLQQVRELLEDSSHFHGRSKSLDFDFHEGALTVRGKLPSFYLKQVLHRVLEGVEHVETVNDRVDVVRCDGLSSEKR